MIEKGKEILRVPYLKAGERVALVSPAYWVPEEAIIQAADVLRSWGLQPVIGPHTTSLNMDVYSGTADERAADLLWALEDDTIKAIFCSRGGIRFHAPVEPDSLGDIPETSQMADRAW